MNKTVKYFAAAALAASLLGMATAPAFAQDTMMKPGSAAKTQMMEKAAPLPFIKAKYKITGDVTIIEKDGQTILRLSDNFKTKNGPDLKLFLSPQRAGDATGKTATQGAVKLDVLRSNKGGQDYVLPKGVNLASFNSLLIHCEQYSVLWGGANLR